MKTIRSWGLAALSLLVLATSCEEERIETKQEQRDISFGMAVGRQTISKAEEFTYWVTADTFTVKSFTPAAGVYQDFKLTYEGTDESANKVWTVNPNNIKQPGYALSYFAYYPADYVSNFAYNSVSKVATFDYVVGGSDGTSQKDFIATDTTTIEQKVVLTFNHLLSQVNFALQGIENVKIEVTNIKLNSIYAAGTYTMGGASDGWTPTTDATNDYTYTPVENTNKTSGANTSISYLGNGGSGNYANTNALMLLPQNFATSNTSATLTFNYILKDMSGNAIGGTTSESSTSVYLSDFTVGEWVKGKRYLYVIDFTSYLENGYISFSVVVNPWEDDQLIVNPIAQTLEVSQANLLSIERAIDLHAGFNVDAKGGKSEDVLTIFPISLNVEPKETITITNIPDKFDKDDVIKIYCKTNAGAQYIKLDENLTSLWSLVTPASAGTGTVVTLTRTAEPYPTP